MQKSAENAWHQVLGCDHFSNNNRKTRTHTKALTHAKEMVRARADDEIGLMPIVLHKHMAQKCCLAKKKTHTEGNMITIIG